jgi:HEAT repeat protein
MKQPTTRARKIIEALQGLLVADDGTIKTITPQQIQTAVDLLRSISSSNENTAKLLTDNQFSIIPYVLPFTLSPQTIVAETAASIVESQSQTISSLHLLQLQDRLRGGDWNYSAHLSQWNAMKLERLSKFFQTHPRLVAMASFHPNGYVREAAVKYLEAQLSGLELPYLLIRLTDWVPQISERAKMALEARLQKDYFHNLIDNLLLIELLSKKRRGSAPEAIASAVFAKIHEALKAPENRPLLLKGLTAPTWETRRMCLKLLKIMRVESLACDGNAEAKLEKARCDAREVIEAVLAEKDVTNRLLIFDFSSDLETAEQIDLMTRLGKDTAPPIRRTALETLCRIDSNSAAQNLEKGLLDSSPLVREFARFKLIQSGSAINFRQFYLEKLQSKPSAKTIGSALAGLGEVGDEEDVEVLLTFFIHPKVGVRKFATLALGKLCTEGHDEVFLQMLDQASIGLSRAATSVISGLLEPVDGPTLFQIFDQTQWKHVKLHAVRLFNSLPKWDRISYLLMASASQQADVKKMATVYVESWEQRYRTSFQFSLPAKEQQNRFRLAIASAGLNFSDQVNETLEACLALCVAKD